MIEEEDIEKATSTLIETNSLKVFPNPFDNILNVKQVDESLITGIVIYDKLGNILIQKSNKDFDNQIEINTSKLNKGIYIIRINHKDGSSQVKQIMKE